MRTRVFTVAITLFALGAQAQAESTESPDVATTLLRLSGLEQQVQSWPAIMQRTVDKGEEHVSSEEQQALRALVASAYEVRALRADLLAAVRNEIARNPHRVEATLGWLRSELGARIVRLEVGATTPAALRERDRFWASFGLGTLSPERRALALRLERAALTQEVGPAVVTEVTLALATALGWLRGEQIHPDDFRLRAAIQSRIEARRGEIQRMVLAGQAYTYRELSQDELSDYVSFLESPPGRWYQRALTDAFLVALRHGRERLFNTLQAALRKRSSRP